MPKSPNTTVLDARLLLCLEEEQRGACLLVPPPGKRVMIFVGVEDDEEVRANFGGCCYRAVVLLNVEYYSTAEAESHAFSNHQFTGLDVNTSALAFAGERPLVQYLGQSKGALPQGLRTVATSLVLEVRNRSIGLSSACPYGTIYLHWDDKSTVTYLCG
ncbi:hypothetical protein MHU86_7515 [Fragilaria crotonensis]|nr:hypothetical protein MHU86_7515 [Fragilaria crotonensis]